MNKNRDRITVDLEPGQKEKLKKLLPWGTMRPTITATFTLLLEFIQRVGIGVAIDSLINSRAKIIHKEEE